MKTPTKFLISIILLSVSFILPGKTNAQTINGPTTVEVVGDFHRQDNIRHATGYDKFDWYGSGDVNNDEKIDSADITALDSPTFDIKNYRADVDGDGTPGTTNDKRTLEYYLTGRIDYLPGHVDEAKTYEEVVDWTKKMIPIERQIREGQTYTQSSDGAFALQSFINFTGVSDISSYITYIKNISGDTMDSTANGLFNLPVRYLGLRNIGGQFDATNLQILSGENPLDVTNYFAFDPETGEEVSLEERLNYDYVSVGSKFKYGQGENEFTFEGNLVKFKIENKEQKEITYMRYFVLRNSPRSSKINMTAPEDITVDKSTYESNPNFLSDFYGSPSVTSNPSEGKDFYWTDPNLDPDMTNVIKGEIKNEIRKSIVDTTYLNSDSTLFRIKKMFVGLVSEIDSVGRSDLGFFGYSPHVLDKDSVYQNITVDLTTGIENEENVPKEFYLYQNYPNPFNGETTICFTIPTTDEVQNISLKIYDTLGRELKTLIVKPVSSDKHQIKFDSNNLPSGIYFYQLINGSQTQTRKMILLK